MAVPRCRIQQLIVKKHFFVKGVDIIEALVPIENICRCSVILAPIHLDTYRIIRNLTRASSVTTKEQVVVTPYILCPTYLRKYLYLDLCTQRL